MQRLAYKELIKWKSSKQRKPLIVQGARQVGKTFLVLGFGKKEYKKLYHFNFELFYWTSKSDAEVDFLVDKSNKIYPLEVKSGTSRNTKSLQSYAAKYHPEKIFRTSPGNLIESGDFINIPLYAIGLLKRLIYAK